MGGTIGAMNDFVRDIALTLEQRRQYADEGYTLLPDLIPPEVVATLRGEVMQIMERIGLGRSKLRQTGQYLAGTAIDALVNSPTLRRIAGELMEGEALLYLPFTAVKSAVDDEGVGGGEFHLHQDNQYTRFDGPGNNLWFALTAMSEDNGCLQMAPGSHLHGTFAAAESPDQDGHRTITFAPERLVPVRMQPGDCCAFTRLTVHGSGPNVTGAHRVAYAVQYARVDIRYSTDAGKSWDAIAQKPRWRTGPVEAIEG